MSALRKPTGLMVPMRPGIDFGNGQTDAAELAARVAKLEKSLEGAWLPTGEPQDTKDLADRIKAEVERQIEAKATLIAEANGALAKEEAKKKGAYLKYEVADRSNGLRGLSESPEESFDRLKDACPLLDFRFVNGHVIASLPGVSVPRSCRTTDELMSASRMCLSALAYWMSRKSENGERSALAYMTDKHFDQLALAAEILGIDWSTL